MPVIQGNNREGMFGDNPETTAEPGAGGLSLHGQCKGWGCLGGVTFISQNLSGGSNPPVIPLYVWFKVR